MPWYGWMFGIMLFTVYITCIFTVCIMTFQKGRWILGIIGIFFPVVWLVGAFLPAKKGSRYELAQEIQYARQAEQYSA